MLINEEKRVALKRYTKSVQQAWLASSLLTLPILFVAGPFIYPETYRGIQLFQDNAYLLWESAGATEFFLLVLELSVAPISWYLAMTLIIALPLTRRISRKERPERRSLEAPEDRRLLAKDYIGRLKEGYTPGLRFQTRREKRVPSYFVIAIIPIALLFVSVFFLS